MKFRLAAIAAMLAVPARAHSGHTEIVDGHSHTLVDLMIMGTVPVLIAVAGIALALYRVRRRND